jgi:hypothetical protein
VPLFLPPLARRDRRRPSLDLAGQRQRGAAHLIEAPASLDPHIEMHAARARRLRPAHQAEVSQRGIGDVGHLAHLRPGHSRHRIEVHSQLVGMIQVVGPDRMGMELQAGEVCEPDKSCCIAGNDFVGAAA